MTAPVLAVARVQPARWMRWVSMARIWIEERMPTIQERIHILGGWRDIQIADPVGGGRCDFERAVEEIEQCLGDWFRYLREARKSVAGL